MGMPLASLPVLLVRFLLDFGLGDFDASLAIMWAYYVGVGGLSTGTWRGNPPTLLPGVHQVRANAGLPEGRSTLENLGDGCDRPHESLVRDGAESCGTERKMKRPGYGGVPSRRISLVRNNAGEGAMPKEVAWCSAKW